ncbi:nuclear transport factor 2 family protein [Rhodococcus sp. NPDC058505]|uniref:nuclear transport factor 2 family protein n=1 Tax=unclassified Rhodococcus (in: high G+C Gram-positive bacteria) TaxID=192944 RepID=UPI00365394AA
MRAWFAAGATTAFTGRYVLLRMLLVKFKRNVDALNAGDHRPLLRSYHRDAVLRFADGDHRWAGVHAGRDAIEEFLKSFVHAGLRGEIVEAYFGGPPWRMTILVRFNDHALAPDGTVAYRNRTILQVRTRWGRIVEQEDFYEDTARIEAFDARLRELGLGPRP